MTHRPSGSFQNSLRSGPYLGAVSSVIRLSFQCHSKPISVGKSQKWDAYSRQGRASYVCVLQGCWNRTAALMSPPENLTYQQVLTLPYLWGRLQVPWWSPAHLPRTWRDMCKVQNLPLIPWDTVHGYVALVTEYHSLTGWGAGGMSGSSIVTGAIRELWLMESTSGSAVVERFGSCCHSICLLAHTRKKTYWTSLVHN